ncbi:hypothetical protein L9F63_013079, partial [Diploptera punctata]
VVEVSRLLFSIDINKLTPEKSLVLQVVKERKTCDSDSIFSPEFNSITQGFRETGIYNFKHFNIFYIPSLFMHIFPFYMFHHSPYPHLKNFQSLFLIPSVSFNVTEIFDCRRRADKYYELLFKLPSADDDDNVSPILQVNLD